LILFFTIHYAMYFNDPLHSEQFYQEMLPKRVFMAKIYKFCFQVIYPTNNALSSGIYFFMGRQLVAILDSKCFFNIYQHYNAKRIFLGSVLAEFLHTLTLYSTIL